MTLECWEGDLMNMQAHAIKLCAAFVCLCPILSSCSQPQSIDWRPSSCNINVSSDTLSIEAVEGLAEDFILGMDASAVPSLEASGVKYYDGNGNEKDVFEILSENGINYIRVRIWNDPFDKDGNGYGGGNCDIENAIIIGTRAAKYGMKLLVNFHYSDFWADPGKQMVPKAWDGMDIDQKSDALYAYTKDSLKRLTKAGALVGMVQIGNETNGSLCGETASMPDGWKNITTLMSAGSRAVREVCPGALVAVHFTNPEKSGTYGLYAQKLSEFGVDYDVFASSYYPYWHGTLENLTAQLSDIAEAYGKKVMVAETSYAYTTENTDFHNNTVGTGTPTAGYPFTTEGQAAFVRDVISAAANGTTNGIGVFYWEGTWISVGTNSYNDNLAKWEKYGSGWASSYAAEYDSDDAGKWYGGCAVENQAFFDEHGRATNALGVFALVRHANNTEGK